MVLVGFMDGELDEDDDCGCYVLPPVEVDGRPVEVHHWIPDDTAEHAPTSECGCGPILHDQVTDQGRLLYEHIDQDVEDCMPPGWPAG
jgi:hypothetical protein